ncbi:MAG: alpha/beta hydrolase [Acidobacteria bacterium]|nr:alpha/beta hydrolase [Acidobacteriota bacterium]
MVRHAALFAGLVLLLLALAWVFQRRMIYFPLGDVPPPGRTGLRNVEEVTFETDDGVRLNAWFVPPATEGNDLAVIVFNGNAGNRAYRAELALRLTRHGIATLLFDYRGYGGNAGLPTEAGLVRDGRAARAYLASRADVNQDGIVYFGESLGAAVAVNLALEHAPRALILRSPFTSLADVAAHHYPFLPVRWLLRDRFPSLDRISQVRCPVLVITAERDSIVPAKQSRRLYEAAQDPKRLLVVPGTDHNDDELVAGQRMIRAILDFLDAST